MKILGMEFLRRKEGQIMIGETDLQDIKKKLEDWENTRTDADDVYRSAETDESVRVPIYPITEKNMMDLSVTSDIMRTVVQVRQNTIFRRGFEVLKDGEEVQDKTFDMLNDLISRINTNGQSLRDVCRMVEDDLESVNNAYVICAKKYFFKANGEVAENLTEIKEFIRGNPLRMKAIANEQGVLGVAKDGQRLFFDPMNRTVLIKENQAEQTGFKSPSSGKKYFEACYRSRKIRGENQNNANTTDTLVYYSRGEVIHMTYDSAVLYGRPKLLSIWMKIITLIEQDRYLMLAYQKQRPPRGLLTMATSNVKSLEKAWASLMAKIRKDPHQISPMLVETQDGKNAIQWIDFMRSLPEMQFTETRNEMRRQIGALFGVMPIFSGDLQTSSGIITNGDSPELTITDDAAKEAQKLYNDKMLPWMLEQMGIEGYELKLKEPKEKDENLELDKLNKRTDHAVKMQQMGFEVKFNSEDETFEFSDEPKEPEPEEEGALVDFPENEVQKAARMHAAERKVFDFIRLDSYKLEGVEYDIKKASRLEEFAKTVAAALFKNQYKGQSLAVSKKINDIILESVINKTPVSNVTKQIMDLGVDKTQTNLIVRTEQATLQNKAREFNFKDATGAENFTYRWLGPIDNRTSDISKEIVRRSAKGLPLEDLKKLVKEVSIKFGFKPQRDWFSHFNQRHTFVRVI